MRVLVAPAAYKGTLTAGSVATALAEGVRQALPTADIDRLLLSDGGDGFLEAFAACVPSFQLRSQTLEGDSPDDGPADWGWLAEFRLALAPDASTEGPVAIAELASVAGLGRLEARHKPFTATTERLGRLLAVVAADAPRRIIVGLGGSASTDGGFGALSALGVRFLDAAGRRLEPAEGPLALARLARIDMASARLGGELVAAVDVENPLLGSAGSVAVFGPQKGITAALAPRFEAALERLADVMEADCGRDVRRTVGGGAAGGAAAGLAGVLGARLISGADLILQLAGFDERLARADLVVTGEGSFDAQSGMGKATGRVIDLARRRGVPLLVVAGHLGDATTLAGLRAVAATGNGRQAGQVEVAAAAAAGVRALGLA